MAESEFPSNSYGTTPRKSQPAKDEEPVKKVEKVTMTEPVRRKKGLGKRFMETFIGGDSKSVAEYVMFDVLIPSAKDLISDVVSQGIDRTLFGESRGARRGAGSYRSPAAGSYTAYNRYAGGSVVSGGPSRREDPRVAAPSRRARATHDFDEFILGTRAEADEVIDRMYDLLSQYEQVTVRDFYDLVGATASFTDERWGWTDLAGSGISRARGGGYIVNLSKPEPLA